VTLTGSNGAIPDVSAPVNLPPTNPSVVSGTTNASGLFTVTFTSASAGQVTGHAATDVSFARLASEQPPSTPLVVHRETTGTAGNGADAVKRFINAEIFIAPSAVNAVGQSHTFTV